MEQIYVRTFENKRTSEHSYLSEQKIRTLVNWRTRKTSDNDKTANNSLSDMTNLKSTIE